jgi:hypothetical protein
MGGWERLAQDGRSGGESKIRVCGGGGEMFFGRWGRIVFEVGLPSGLLISGHASARPDVPRWRPKR